MWVKMIQDSGPEELVDLHLVPGRHRSRRRRLGHHLRRRHPRLFHEWRRQQGEGQSRLPRLRAPIPAPKRRRRTSGSGRWRMNNASQAEGRRLVLDAMGVVDRARSVRRAQDGLRQSRSATSVWKDDEFRDRIDKSYPRLSRAIRRVGAGRQDLLHAAAAVLRRDHPMGGDAAEDGRQGGAGRRRARPAGRSIDKQLKEAGLG